MWSQTLYNFIYICTRHHQTHQIKLKDAFYKIPSKIYTPSKEKKGKFQLTFTDCH